ncbi:GGDEF domain-containing protein [Bacterioplanoides sp.]|uniref:GGDEF domain-containing protein n=1 Tax=Bacterioplanoides sp. TaxID=2066072 RepID=UPI003B5AF8FB
MALQQLPYIFAGVIITLAQLFNQGRLANLALLITASFALIQTQLQVNLEANAKYEIYYWLSMIIPLNLVVIRLLPEKRPLSLPGSAYLIIMLLQALLLTNLDALFGPLPQLQNLWALDISWQRDLPAQLQEFLANGHLGLLPLTSLAFSLLILVLCIRVPRHNDLVFITLALMFAGMFYQFATPHISVLISSFAMMLLFANLIMNNHRLAFIDELTGLPARRALLNDLDHRWGSYCLVMADIDHFKQFNDTHGHDVGDDVLRLVAQQLGKAQGGGKAYRYGGEEFTLVFPIADDLRCQSYVEELRERIADYPLVIRNRKNRPETPDKGQQQRSAQNSSQALHVTMSFGLAQRRRGESIDALFKRADVALYEAKKLGRNQVHLAKR